jgi:uncharacterized phage protein (TIGR01671 family)
MDDRLKFRAWCKEASVMFGVDWFTDKQAKLNCDDWEFGKYQEIKPVPLEQIFLMQCSGLRDKNKKLIFEGDIIRREWGLIAKICFIHNEFVAIDLAFSANVTHLHAATTIGDNYEMSDKTEIIGNIYANPELLEVSNGGDSKISGD